MKIIKIPQTGVAGREMLSRVLTFANGSFALHYVRPDGENRYSLYDKNGELVKENVRAESVYVLGNGTYILMFEPLPKKLGSGKDAINPYFVFCTRDGKRVFEDIEYFVPLRQDWIVLRRQGRKMLYTDRLALRDSSQKDDFVKFSGGYARVHPRYVAIDSNESIMLRDAGKTFSDFSWVKRLWTNTSEGTQGFATDWELLDDDGNSMFTLKNCFTVLDGCFAIALLRGTLFSYMPDGTYSAETELCAGIRETFFCAPNLIRSRCVSGYYPDRETQVDYFSKDGNAFGSFWLTGEFGGLYDLYEFSNGNYSGVWRKKLCFFKKNSRTPLVELPENSKICFAPDGCYLDYAAKKLLNPEGKVVLEQVEGLVDFDDWYLADLGNGVYTVFDLMGNKMEEKVILRRKVNGLLLLEQADGKLILLHRSGKVISLDTDFPELVTVENSVF